MHTYLPRHFDQLPHVLIGLCLVMIGGCASGPGGPEEPGPYAMSGGTLWGYEPATMEQTWQATQEAVQKLEFALKDSAKDAISASLYATRANGDQVWIDLTRRKEVLTQVGVKVGIWGNEEASRLIAERIKTRLRAVGIETPAATAPPAP